MGLPHSIEDQQARSHVPFQLQVVEMWVGKCSSLRRKIDVRTQSSFRQCVVQGVYIPVKTPTPIAKATGKKLRLIVKCVRLELL